MEMFLLSSTVNGSWDLLISANGNGDVSFGDTVGATIPVNYLEVDANDVVLGQSIVISENYDAVLSARNDFINNDGSSALSTSGTGRWVIYTKDDDQVSNFNNLDSSNTAIWGQTFSSLPLNNVSSGNRYVFAEESIEQLNFTTTDIAKTYGMTLDLSGYYTLTSLGISGLSGVYEGVPSGTPVDIDLVYDIYPTFSTSDSDGTLVNADVGTYSINASGGTIKPGYAVSFSNDGVLIIEQKPVSVTGITASDKVYDSVTTATVDVTGIDKADIGILAGDTVIFNATGVFSDKNVGTGKIVTLTSGTTGADASNYAFTHQTSTTADISAKPVTVTGITASNKVYDGLTGAVVDVSGIDETGIGILAGDTGTVTINATGEFSDKNVGAGKTVTLTSGTSGADASNYAFTHQASTTADITAKPVTVMGITASNKVYDGLIGATVDVSGIDETGIGILAGDTGTVTISATGEFSDKNVGAGKTVTLTRWYIWSRCR